MNKDLDLSLYLVTDRNCMKGRDFKRCIEDAILGGVTIVQLREKNISSSEFYSMAVEVKKVTDLYNIPLIINDRIDIAMACNASGVHLGQEDMPCSIARKLLGNNKIIGVSAHDVKEALKAQQDGATYVGCGSVFSTSTKKNVSSLKISELQNIKNKVTIKTIAIGGIDNTNISLLNGTGIDGVAVVSAILSSSDIKTAASNLKYSITSLQ